MKPKNTDKYGRNKEGKFAKGNSGKPKGSTNKTTRQLRESIVHFLNDKVESIFETWDTLDPKDQVTLFLHLSKLVIPNIPKEAEQDSPLPAPVIILSKPAKEIPPQGTDLNE